MARPPRARRPGKGQGSDADGRLEDRPPFLSWRGIYFLVLGALAVQVVLFTVLARVMR